MSSLSDRLAAARRGEDAPDSLTETAPSTGGEIGRAHV